ncbi:MAG: hypothetical protein Q8O55_06350 [Dehalococcoidales bacterium]|nr:hypothetical protein [Dehalococcoidales bacterium]
MYLLLVLGAAAAVGVSVLCARRHLEKEALSLSEDRSDEIVKEARRSARKIIEDAKMVGAWWNQSRGSNQ